LGNESSTQSFRNKQYLPSASEIKKIKLNPCFISATSRSLVIKTLENPKDCSEAAATVFSLEANLSFYRHQRGNLCCPASNNDNFWSSEGDLQCKLRCIRNLVDRYWQISTHDDELEGVLE
jgi:hypothetical protein